MYRNGYRFLEQHRILMKKPKSAKRLETEAIWGPGGYDLVHDDGKRYYIPDSQGYVDPTIFDIDACRAKWGGAFEQGP